ncbi:glycosyltransferase family 4 protein [Hassallia byssoidea VB512170]|uniref:Glycosyltransferase family 4 protein n=1 Tax=Hassallia byssoidea VB512170 TaxID=1304833 RepID=A0A846H4V0_9CYAN|nr:glycosyltransferase family 4 protein [Hassalia byssoidea]NEU71610.1 glycosyltransferase family 4 protein [Hassalia byssoidea VB512170]
MLRIAYFVSHPIQYQAPLLRLIAADPEIELKVFFYNDFSLKPYQDLGFGRVIEWDVPLIEGYDYCFLNSWGSKQQQMSQQSLAKDISKQLKQGQFDAVWVHGWSWLCSIQVVLAANRLGIPVLLRGETSGLGEPTHPLKKRAKRAFLNWLFPKIAAFLYIGTLNRQFYKNYGVEDDRLFCVPYAVDNDYFQQRVILARPNREELRRSLNLDFGRPIILYAAKLIEVKRPQDLLAAYRLLSSDGIEPKPYLLFVGDGILRLTLEAEAKKTNWQSIRFLGFRNQSEMPAIYDLCDVFVLPSNFEPWGLAINEVMNAGKAVVVSDRVGCAPDLVREGQNGRIFPVGEITDLAEAIRFCIDHQTAGDISLKQIQKWSYQEDIQGLKQALNYLKYKVAE